MSKLLILVLLFNPSFTRGQISIEKVDTSRQSLQGIDTLKSCGLVKDILKDFLNHGSAAKVAAHFDLPIIIDQKNYLTRQDLIAYFQDVIRNASESRANPKVSQTFVLGRRKELMNGFINIDFLYVVGVIRFDIDGQTSEKMAVFAIRNLLNPTIAGMHVE